LTSVQQKQEAGKLTNGPYMAFSVPWSANWLNRFFNVLGGQRGAHARNSSRKSATGMGPIHKCPISSAMRVWVSFAVGRGVDSNVYELCTFRFTGNDADSLGAFLISGKAMAKNSKNLPRELPIYISSRIDGWNGRRTSGERAQWVQGKSDYKTFDQHRVSWYSTRFTSGPAASRSAIARLQL
jgi:hypothetical protein